MDAMKRKEEGEGRCKRKEGRSEIRESVGRRRGRRGEG